MSYRLWVMRTSRVFFSYHLSPVTCHLSPVTCFRFPVGQSLLRLPLYKDRRACAAGTCPAPKLPGMTNSRAPQHHRQLRRFFSAADESKRVPACPSTTAVRSNSFCQGTFAEPDPSKAAAPAVVRSLPIPASDKCARIRPSRWSGKATIRISLQRNAEKESAL